MLKIIIPKSRYGTTTYPNLNPESNGAPIPEAIGDIHNIVPVCIDTILKKFKIAARGIHELSEVRSGVEALVLGTDYTEDLPNAEFTIVSTPLVEANTQYYFLIESDIAIDGINYYGFERNLGTYFDKAHNPIANGSLFDINGADVWSNTGFGLYYEVYGKTDLAGNESCIVLLYDNKYLHKSGHWTVHPLRDAAARTKIAQSFTTPVAGGPWYVTKIKVGIGVHGALAAARITTISILDAAKVQIGCKSYRYEDAQGKGRFPIRAEASNISCDIEGSEKGGLMISSLADTVEFLVVTVLGKSASLLDPVHLANLAAQRTHVVKFYLDEDGTTFGQIAGKLESGQLWKLINLLDGTYATIVYEAGEPANTPHFHDGDYINFKMWMDYSAVKQIVKIKYDKDAQSNEYKVSESASDIAKFFYRNEESLEVETYLHLVAGANWLKGKLGPMYEIPPLMAEFEVHGYGLDLIPGRDKVKLTKERAMYANGTLNGVLFRIKKLAKKPGTSTTVITCQLDSQTY